MNGEKNVPLFVLYLQPHRFMYVSHSSKSVKNPQSGYMGKYCMLKTSVVWSKFLFTVMARHTWLGCIKHVLWSMVYVWVCFFLFCQHVLSVYCTQLLQLTVARLSRWRSLPLPLRSAQTQTGPEKEGTKLGENIERGRRRQANRVKSYKDASMNTHTHTLIGGTFVRTKPGLWSLICSSAAAMSISFTPNDNDRDSKGITVVVLVLQKTKTSQFTSVTKCIVWQCF